MIENLQNELKKQEKGAKLPANIRSWRANNAPKLSSKYLKDKSAKKITKLYTKWTSTAAITEFVCKTPNRKKISNEHYNLCEAEISLDEIIKSINSETNNKPPGNDGLTAEFYRHFSNELAPVLLGVYDCWGKLDTMGVTYRRAIISAIRAISRTNYFRKTAGRTKWEVPKYRYVKLLEKR